jgi:acyl-CoA thioester hydrolase
VKLGNSSVRYKVGIFRAGDESAVAQKHFVHVYVDSASRRPAALPKALRTLLQTIHI